jgi:hypothetical protein
VQAHDAAVVIRTHHRGGVHVAAARAIQHVQDLLGEAGWDLISPKGSSSEFIDFGRAHL